MTSLFFVTPQLGRARGGLGVSAERVIGHLRALAPVHVFELTDELPPATYARCGEAAAPRTRISSLGDRKQAYQLLVDRMLAEAPVARPSHLASFYASDASWAVTLAGRLLGLPTLVFARGNNVDLDPFGESGPRILASLAEAEQVFCVSRELAHKVSRFSPGARVRYVPNGVDPEAFSFVERAAPGPRSEIGIFGDLKAKKGLELLLGQLDFARHTLRIVGSMRAEPEKYLHGYVTLFPERMASIAHEPFCEDLSALRAAYARVDVVCLPSLHEGMSNVMLEAMSSGAICVASRIGGALDVIEDGRDGFLFDAGDEVGLGEALRRADRAARDPERSVARAARAKITTGYTAAQEGRAYAAALSAR